MATPTVYKALRFEARVGDLHVTELQARPLQPYELLVRVHAASINPLDSQLWRSGLAAVVAGEKGMGRDFSGTVEAAGSQVKGFSKGDDVFGLLYQIVCFSISSPTL